MDRLVSHTAAPEIDLSQDIIALQNDLNSSIVIRDEEIAELKRNEKALRQKMQGLSIQLAKKDIELAEKLQLIDQLQQ